MRSSFQTARVAFLAGIAVLVQGSTLSAQEPKDDVRKLIDEINKNALRPTCLITEHGFFRHVLITRDATGVFEKPERGAKRLRTLGVNERLYLFAEDRNGFHEVGPTPFTKFGWVSKHFCVNWDHNLTLLLDRKAVSGETTPVLFWKTEEDARKGDPAQAIFSGAAENLAGRLLPILKGTKDGKAFQVTIPFGGDQATRDDYGHRPATDKRLREIIQNSRLVNIVLLVEHSSHVLPQVQQQLLKLYEACSNTRLRSRDGKNPIDLTIKFAVLTYGRLGDEFVPELLLPLTTDRQRIAFLASQRFSFTSGSPKPVSVTKALGKALEVTPSSSKGALTRVLLIGGIAPSVDADEHVAEIEKVFADRFIQVDAFAWGAKPKSKAVLHQLSKATGGTANTVNKAPAFTKVASDVLRSRLTEIPLELAVLQSCRNKAGTLREVFRKLDTPPKAQTKVYERLKGRGAGSVLPEFAPGTAWIRADSAHKLYLFVPRSVALRTLADLLGSYTRIRRGVKVIDSATSIPTSLLLLHAEANPSNVGEVQKQARRLPVVSRATIGGARGVVRSSKSQQALLRKLLTYSRSKECITVGQHVLLPFDLVP